jgi:hypothetical protein
MEDNVIIHRVALDAFVNPVSYLALMAEHVWVSFWHDECSKKTTQMEFLFSNFMTDAREGYCYAAYENGNCQKPSKNIMTRSMCCCGFDSETMAWGHPCEQCPKPGSEELSKLCPFGPGKSFNGHGKIVITYWSCHTNCELPVLYVNFLSRYQWVLPISRRVWKRNLRKSCRNLQMHVQPGFCCWCDWQKVHQHRWVFWKYGTLWWWSMHWHIWKL